MRDIFFKKVHFNFKLKVSTISLPGAGMSTKYIIAKKANKIAKKDKLI